jgi:hypothetical protein
MIQKLAHGLQETTINSFFTTMFRAGFQSYLEIATIGMKKSTLQHKETAMLCEEGMTTAKTRSALLVPHNTKQATPPKEKQKVIQGKLTSITQIVE